MKDWIFIFIIAMNTLSISLLWQRVRRLEEYRNDDS